MTFVARGGCSGCALGLAFALLLEGEGDALAFGIHSEDVCLDLISRGEISHGRGPLALPELALGQKGHDAISEGDEDPEVGDVVDGASDQGADGEVMVNVEPGVGEGGFE